VDSLEGGEQGVLGLGGKSSQSMFEEAILKMNHGQESWLKQRADIRREC